MPNRLDPTRTTFLRNTAARAVRVRFNRIAAVIPATAKAIIESDTGVLVGNARAAERRQFEFLSDAEKLVAFREWLGEQISIDILTEQRGADHWLLSYFATAFERGATLARAQAGAELLRQAGFAAEGYSALNNPRVAASAEALFARSFEALKGVTDTMSAQMNRVLSDSLVLGDNPRVAARKLRDRINKIGKTRSELIARTEITRANNIGKIAEIDDISNLTGYDFLYRWATGEDARVRPEHQTWNRQIYTREEALARIGAPNCRCAVIPIPQNIEEFEDA